MEEEPRAAKVMLGCISVSPWLALEESQVYWGPMDQREQTEEHGPERTDRGTWTRESRQRNVDQREQKRDTVCSYIPSTLVYGIGLAKSFVWVLL